MILFQVIPHFGKAAANTWQELARVRVKNPCQGRVDDCVQNCISKIKECQETECMLKRMHERAHLMTGRARAALLAWFAVMSHRVAGSHAPVNWSNGDRKNYLQELAQISEMVTKEGKPTVHTKLIEELAARIQHNYNNFSAETC